MPSPAGAHRPETRRIEPPGLDTGGRQKGRAVANERLADILVRYTAESAVLLAALSLPQLGCQVGEPHCQVAWLILVRAKHLGPPWGASEVNRLPDDSTHRRNGNRRSRYSA
jgi:hypothetical protein